MSFPLPSAADIERQHKSLSNDIRWTPVLNLPARDFGAEGGGKLWFKLELFQQTGSFKARGALSAARKLDASARARGVVAVSAGNHAIATAFAAAKAGSSAHVVMMKHANPLRIERCRSYGAKIDLVDDVHSAFERAALIAECDGRTMMHPFDSPSMVMGSATLGFEFAQDLGALDAVIIPIGGGGLAAGMSHALKSIRPEIRIYGVEPVGADSMAKSFKAGAPQSLSSVQTIADSLGAPFAMSMTFEMCRNYLEEVVLIDDNMMTAAMRLLLTELKVAVEPAGAAATAALLGPLRDRLAGQTVGLIVCGANIDPRTFAGLVG